MQGVQIKWLLQSEGIEDAKPFQKLCFSYV